MANHSPKRDNYVQKKTFAEAMGEAEPVPDADRGAQLGDEKKSRAANKGAAAKNGGGEN